MKYKIDLHTHSNFSFDGGIHLEQYRQFLDDKKLDFVAVTDHNLLHNALVIHDTLGSRIIAGEEIKSQGGDIIGLYLTQEIKPGLSVKQTVEEIKVQGGLVYIPHPFDSRRSGLSRINLDSIIEDVDIIETYNARFLGRKGNQQAFEYNRDYGKPAAAGSDAHGVSEIGKTYSVVNQIPLKENLCELLQIASYKKKLVSPRGFFNPTINRIRHKIRR